VHGVLDGEHGRLNGTLHLTTRPKAQRFGGGTEAAIGRGEGTPRQDLARPSRRADVHQQRRERKLS